MISRISMFTSLWVALACTNKPYDSAQIELTNHLSPAGPQSGEPFLFSDENESVYLSWLEKQEQLHVFKYSKLESGQWSEPVPIASDSTWFVNWADYPMMAVNRSGNFLSHVLARSGEGKFHYDVKMFCSNNGTEWTKSFLLNNDNKKAEHGFVTIIPYGENFLVTWLDGRNTIMEGIENMKGMDHGGDHGSMSLRAAILNSEGDKINEWELDNKTCDCCQTTAAITDNGPVVIYRDRSDNEIRDISITRLVNDSWTEPTPIYEDNWKIAGCPVNGPRASSIGNNLVTAWFSIVEEVAQVKVVFSSDGGGTFTQPIRIDQGKTIGRVDVLWLNDQAAVVSWMEGSEIKAVRVMRDGTVGTAINIAASSESRSSGFPQMTKSVNEIIFAWTDSQEKTIKVASVSTENLP